MHIGARNADGANGERARERECACMRARQREKGNGE